MNLQHGKKWFFSIIAIITLTASTGYLFASDSASNESAMVEFIELSDAEIDMILAVKAKMQAAKIQAK